MLVLSCTIFLSIGAFKPYLPEIKNTIEPAAKRFKPNEPAIPTLLVPNQVQNPEKPSPESIPKVSVSAFKLVTNDFFLPMLTKW